MIESREEPDERESGLTESVREESDPGAGQGYEADSGPDPEGVQPDVPVRDPEGDPTVLPGTGGYAGRDPKTDMPATPSVPESQDDPLSHDAAPDDETSPESFRAGKPSPPSG